MKPKAVVYLVASILMFFGTFSNAYDWGTNPGDGSAGNPYQISTPEHLASIGGSSAMMGKNFILMNDLNMDPVVTGIPAFTQAVIAPDANNANDDFDGFPFLGIFDGQGHTISNLKIDAGGSDVDHAGLFGMIERPAVIRNLHLLNVRVRGDYEIGGLVGYNHSTVEDCTVTGADVAGDRRVGALAGKSKRWAQRCQASGTVSGNYEVGGITGYQSEDMVDCQFQGTVQGGSFVGGLVGMNMGRIRYCHSEGTVTNTSYCCGGLVGFNDTLINNTIAIIENCYSNSTLSGNGDVGGLVGQNRWGNINFSFATGIVNGIGPSGGLVGNNDEGYIYASYARGNVSAGYTAGGLVGVNYGGICASYSTGTVTAQSSAGGLVGGGYSSMIYLSYWNTTTSGRTNSAGGIGKTSSQLRTLSTFTGWGDGIWVLDEGNDFPRLAWEGTTGTSVVDPARTYGGGSGTADYPYLISTPEQLNTIGLWPADQDKYFSFTNNIDLSEVTYHQIGYGKGFSGRLEGNGFAVKNLKIIGSSEDYAGLFACLCPGSLVENLTLENVDIQAGIHVGALAGTNDQGTIQSCSVSGSIQGDDYVGGLVGVNYGKAQNASFQGSVTATWDVGGAAGLNSHGTLYNCSVAATVTSSSYYAGGLAGANWNGGSIIHCSSAGQVQGTYNIGGLTGENYSIITDSYSTADISGTQYVGGLTGQNGYLLNKCFSRGRVQGQSIVGGAAGLNSQNGQILKCYASGEILADSIVGGLVGNNDGGNVIDSFWDMESSGQNELAGNIDGGTLDVLGETTANMKRMKTFTAQDWIFFEGSDTWVIKEFLDYPMFAWQQDYHPYSGGAGTPEDPYQIRCWQDLLQMNVVHGDYAKHFILMNDLNLDSSVTNLPAFERAPLCENTNDSGDLSYAGQPFTGSLDGNSHAISHLTINPTAAVRDFIGLFGMIAADGVVKNLALTSFSIQGQGMLGGISGQNEGHIEQCYTTGVISGVYFVGGLTGFNVGDIAHSYSRTAVSGEYDVAGLAGYNEGAIVGAYASGAVNCLYTGGLLGENYGSIAGCVWDTQSTGQSDGVGMNGGTADVYGKLTAEMQSQTAFTDPPLLWDFYGEDANGAQDFWRMREDAPDAPKLAWQFIEQDINRSANVNFSDFALFAQSWLKNSADPAYNDRCDLNGDNIIDTLDLAIFLEKWMFGAN